MWLSRIIFSQNSAAWGSVRSFCLYWTTKKEPAAPIASALRASCSASERASQ
jgi:hypothetical protein